MQKINIKNEYKIFSNWEEKFLSLSEIFSEEKNILFFYPRDNTPGCTVENKDFTCLKNEFNKLWVKIIWVSKDSMESHWKFIAKQALENDLISDVELSLHKELWAYWEKNNYWKIVMWVIRSTFLISKDWEVLKEWRNIRAKWHAERILKEIS